MTHTLLFLATKLVVLLVLTTASLSQFHSERRCHAYDFSCSECIQAPGCQWCSEFIDNSSNAHRCYSSAEDSRTVCKTDFITNPQNAHTIVSQRPLSELSKKDIPSQNEDIIQISPQRIKLYLRKGEPYNITFKFRLAMDYPLDLYYLMDLSHSMKDDKENLGKLGQELARTMRRLTTLFRLGFGSFVDKIAMPYVNTHPARINEPCYGCASPYSFKNELPLTQDDRLFTEKVQQTPISGNVDSPEGGFDALLQAIVCWKEIGWRQQARRLLIMSTDAKFHHAGDGKLAGIVTPHDGACHLNDHGEYTAYNQFDYPSIAQINEAARENQVSIIFAVSNHQELYKTLSESIDYSSSGMLDSQSSNVVSLVTEQYNKISSEVKLTDNVESIPGSPVTVRYFSNCLDRAGAPRLTSTCKGFKPGNETEFIAEIEVVSIPRVIEQRSFQINITTLQDTLTLDVEIMADCGCEKRNARGRVVQSPACSSVGTLQCGVCSCPAGYYGNNCQCSSTTTGSRDSSQDREQCLADPNAAKVCSGQGECECGTCICSSPSLTGKYCECNSDLCYGNDRRECNGRGSCDCDHCRCQLGWAGRHCECPDDRACIFPGSSEICSGKGDCLCGQCSCHSIDNVVYTGKHCEECSTCSSGKCLEFKDCVQCRYFKSGPLEGYPCNNCTIRPNVLSTLDAQVAAGARLCTFMDEKTGCEFNFTYEYRYNDQDYFIVVQKVQKCPEALDVIAVVLGVIGGIVAIGLLTLLLWKILTTIHDRREFAKFEAERRNVRWAEVGSPLYESPKETFVNPTFGRQISVKT